MNNRDTILKEIELVAPTLVKVGNGLPFTIPINYFTNLHEIILAFVQENTLISLPKASFAYTVPENYFNTLSTNILAKVKMEEDVVEVEDELKTIAPTLLQINRANVYTVPVDYFNTILVPNTTATKAKIISVQNWFNWRTIAIAASFVAIFFTSNYVYKNYQSKNEFEAYKKVDIKKSILTASDDDLQQYLTTGHEDVNLDIAAVENELDITEPHQKIEATTDDELKQYLKETEPLLTTIKQS